MENEKVPTVKENDIIISKCISIGKKGDGIFKYDGFVVIVPNTEINKTYTLKITKVLNNLSFAEVVEE